MNRREAMALALGLMAKHGLLPEYTFKFDRAVQRGGSHHYGKRRITLSGPLTELRDEAEVKQTILHEIAHALTWKRYGSLCARQPHGAAWRMVCREIGAVPRACSESEVAAPSPWTGECASCGERFPRYRRLKVGVSGHIHTPCKFKPEHGEVVWHRSADLQRIDAERRRNGNETENE